MNKIETVGMDTISELASAIVERQFYISNKNSSAEHSFTDENGDYVYIEEVQDEFLAVLDLIDSILNPEV